MVNRSNKISHENLSKNPTESNTRYKKRMKVVFNMQIQEKTTTVIPKKRYSELKGGSSVDVIDLGISRELYRDLKLSENSLPSPHSLNYRPNPRLYPGVKAKKTKRARTLSNFSEATSKRQFAGQQPVARPAQDSRPQPKRGGRKRRRLRKRIAAVSARLYNPPPLRPRKTPPPPLVPSAPWAPPPLVAPSHTASDVALQLADLSSRGSVATEAEITSGSASRVSLVGGSKQRPVRKCVLKQRVQSTQLQPSVKLERQEPSVLGKKLPALDLRPRTPRLAVTLPTGPPPANVYYPKSKHFRQHSLEPSLQGFPRRAAMAAANPLDDSSDGNDSGSATSEFLLAEFLSAIMRRNYVTALRYCRLILQSEPQNTTARSFYPLLVQKAGATLRDEAEQDSDGSDGSADVLGAPVLAGGSDSPSYESLSLDSSRSHSVSASPESSASPAQSPQHSPAARHCIPTLSLDADQTPAACRERWQSALSSTSSMEWGLKSHDGPGPSSPDDNGNPALPSLNTDDEDENENASGDHTELLKDPQLQALRAQFACSIIK